MYRWDQLEVQTWRSRNTVELTAEVISDHTMYRWDRHVIHFKSHDVQMGSANWRVRGTAWITKCSQSNFLGAIQILRHSNIIISNYKTVTQMLQMKSFWRYPGDWSRTIATVRNEDIHDSPRLHHSLASYQRYCVNMTPRGWLTCWCQPFSQVQAVCVSAKLMPTVTFSLTPRNFLVFAWKHNSLILQSRQMYQLVSSDILTHSGHWC